ncbi:MAG TPA: GntR family transcriptional regulator [Candidatus Dormibacteraeota bacterium]|nr:GntR family transcriptional regulator [Candidatus Dormibacteraeota bacterium]
MEFFLESHSPLAPHLQIKEQVKLALLLGRLRPGDTLPSIRDVEEQTGVGRNIVRKAYLELEQSGVLTLRHGKGVLVAKQLNYKHDSRLLEQCEDLSRGILSKIRHLGISPTAFARYLYQKAGENERSAPSIVYVDATKRLALERSAKISEVWQANVSGFAIDELTELTRSGRLRPVTVLTNYFRLDQVQKVVGKRASEVIPLGLSFAPAMLDEFSRLPNKASVALILDDDDYPSLSLILASYRELLINDTVKLSAMPFSEVPNLQKYLATGKHHKVIISNRIWEQVPDDLKKHNRLTRPLMEVDLASLESVRIKAGIIV